LGFPIVLVLVLVLDLLSSITWKRGIEDEDEHEDEDDNAQQEALT